MKRKMIVMALLVAVLGFFSLDASAQNFRNKRTATHQYSKVIVVKNNYGSLKHNNKHHHRKMMHKNKYYKKQHQAFVNHHHHKTVKVVYLTPRMMKHGRRA